MNANPPEGESWTTYYEPLFLEPGLEVETTLFAIRMFEGAKLHEQLIRCDGVTDDEVLGLLGLDLVDDEKAGSAALLRKAVEWQREHLEREIGDKPCKQVTNLRRLCDFLHFDKVEHAAVYLGLMLSQSSDFSDLLRVAHRRHSFQGKLALFSRTLGVDASELRRALRSDGRPGRMGLVEEGSYTVENVPTIPEHIRFALETDEFDAPMFLRKLVRRAPEPKLAMDDFAHLPQLPTLVRFLTQARDKLVRGANVLLYGRSGTGKTELARTLAACIGSELYEVPNENDEGGPISGRRRFGAYVLSQYVLADQSRAAVLFDEAEDVFERLPMWLPDSESSASARGKSWINDLLETNATPTIWTCNEINGFDRAHLRRFDIVVEMRTPPRSVRRRIVDRYFEPGEITAPCADRLAGAEDLPPAVIERAARVVHTFEGDNIQERDATAVRLVEDSLRAMGLPAHLPPLTLPTHYDPAFINADRELGSVVEGLRKRPHARFCLYGPPGTGKTAFAHHIGRSLDLPILVRRGSDLLSMYVGGTEALIAEAFQSARDENAILVIDEADGFLRDRAGARQAWEVTQVNELLTQMEAFEGIFIASTNLMDSLDAAALRRFDFKSHFGYLKSQQRRALLARVCGVEASTLEGVICHRLERLDTLTPGDFANALRQLSVLDEGVEPARVIELLAAEAALKPETRHRPIGFAA